MSKHRSDCFCPHCVVGGLGEVKLSSKMKKLHVHSDDSRKPFIVGTFKAAYGSSRITSVKEWIIEGDATHADEHMFEAHCLLRQADGTYKSQGIQTISTEMINNWRTNRPF